MKNYKNGKYDRLIEMKVQEMEFQEEFKPFVADIIKRRAYQYDFTEIQVNLDLNRLANSLKKITVNSDVLSCAGSFYPIKKKINLNPLFCIISDNKTLYSTFTHELYHALASENGIDTMGGINIYSGEYNRSLPEILVEKASYRTVFPVKTKNIYYNSNAEGYESMTFATEMLTSAFGITEQELLGNSIQGRHKLISFLESKTYFNYEQISNFLDHFEMNLAVIHRNLYGYIGEKDKLIIRGKNMSEALGNMKDACAIMMLMNFKNIPEEELTKDKFEDLKYNYNKLNEVVKLGSRNIRIDPENIGFSLKRVNEISNESMEAYSNGIMQTEYILNLKKKHSFPEELKKYERWARFGNLSNLDLEKYRNELNGVTLKDLGIVLPKRIKANTLFDISEKAIQRNQPPKEKTEPWDNTIIKQMGLRKIIYKTEVRNILSQMKNLMSGRKKIALLPGENVAKETSNNYNRRTKFANFKEKIKQLNYNEKNTTNRINTYKDTPRNFDKNNNER